MSQNLLKGGFEELKDKEYRDAYVEGMVSAGIPFQIRSMRNDRKWNQDDLGERAGKKQSWISAVENDEKGSYTLNTLFQLAAAFDVGLVVKFVPYGKFLKEYEDVSPSGLSVESFEDELARPDRAHRAEALLQYRDYQMLEVAHKTPASSLKSKGGAVPLTASRKEFISIASVFYADKIDIHETRAEA